MSSLQEILTKSSDCYYNTGEYYQFTQEDYSVLKKLGIEVASTEVTDSIFDLLNEEYQKLNSISNNVTTIGAPISDQDARKVKLPIPLPSINECKEGEVLPFLDKVVDAVNPQDVIVMEKLDGCSCLLMYHNNQLMRAYTRGDGVYGQDITELVQKIKNLPVFNNETPSPDTFFVRGELIFYKKEIPHILKAMEQEDGKPRKNGRNAIAGQLNAKKINSVFLNNVNFVPYQLIQLDSNNRFIYKRYKALELHWLERTMSRTCDYHIIEKKELTEERLIREVDYFKINSKYECDGIVIVPDFQTEQTYAPTSESNPNPKGVCKYKVNSLGLNETVSVVEDVEWAVSKGGLLKPRVKIQPKVLMDTLITYITGNNYKYIVDNKIGPGAKVKIKRAGDVIPKIIEVLAPATEPKLPEKFVLKDGDCVEAYAPDTEDSLKEQAIKQFLFSCMYYKLEQAGDATVRTLYENRIHNLPELISFAKTSSLEGFRNILGANGVKLHNDIMHKFFVEGTTKPDFCAALNAFGRNIGHRLLDRVDAKYNTLNVDREELMAVEGFSYINAEKYMQSLPYAIKVMEWFDTTGIRKKPRKIIQGGAIKVVFTGIRDRNLEQAIEKQGGIVLQTIARANLVVAKNPNGNSSKLTKARERGITIISIQEAREMFGEANVR